MSTEPILILKTGEPPAPVKAKYADFEEWIAKGMGLPVADVRVANAYLGESLPVAHEIAGVVVTGSPAMVTERADWSESSAQWLAEIVREDSVPVLGLCYGHQLLAHGLGGKVGLNPRGREMGTKTVTFSESEISRAEHRADALFSSLGDGPNSIPAHFSHSESVLEPPADTRVIASTRLDPHSILAFGPRQWGVQFHPEFDQLILEAYVDARREILVSEGLDPDGLMASIEETPAARGLLSRFASLALGDG